MRMARYGRIARRLFVRLAALGAVTSVVGAGAVATTFWYFGQDIAEIDEVALRNHCPPQVTRILARDGRVIGEIYSQRRTVIRYEVIPHHVEDAFLAAEDSDFYHHEGMDYLGMVRALVANIRARRIRQGASTITQQVVKNFLLSSERTFERKVQELILARRLEEAFDKREILELYLNEIYLGHGRYGIEEGSRYYFGKSVTEISVGQAATLATLPKAPSTGSPFRDPERAKERQVYVLQQMAKNGFIAQRDARRFIDAPLDLTEDPGAIHARGQADEFVDVARAKLVEIYGEARLDTLGATVTTAVDLDLQASARDGLHRSLRDLDHRRGYGHGIKTAGKQLRERAIQKGSGALRIGKVVPVVIAKSQPIGEKSDQLDPGFWGHMGAHSVFVRVPKGSRYDDSELTMAQQFPPGGVTRGRVVAIDDTGHGLAEIASGPESTVLLASVESGEVLAMIGGDRFRRGDFNRATSAQRQPGSAFKPLVYGAALASRKFSAASLISDSPEIYEKWRPTNYERDTYRGDIRMRVALTHSVNTVAIKILDRIGIPAVHDFSRAAGIRAPLADNLSLALGTSEVAPYDLLRAYLTLARGGRRLDPVTVLRIEVPGEEDWVPDCVSTQTIEPEVAFVTGSLMRSVVEEGTARGAQKLGRPVAGKTGTSADNRDAWFAGFTPRHVAVAWVGFDTPKRMPRETGGRAALPVWLAAMAAAEGESSALDFVPPPGVSVRSIDKKSGLLAPALVFLEDGREVAPDQDTVMDEFFVFGTEPLERANLAAANSSDVLLDLYDEDIPDSDLGTPLPSLPDVDVDGAAPGR